MCCSQFHRDFAWNLDDGNTLCGKYRVWVLTCYRRIGLDGLCDRCQFILASTSPLPN